ncbi:GNAT family N-acetyltransferase [Streptomyces cyaneofuscatus]|uniref:GNAT family N-acetyltransferase n=1 Tax=Streptomyces cyaneofuscatus TaxID=66883 RepID=UPI0036E103A4
MDLAQTASAVEAIIAALAPETSRLLVVHVEGELAVWLNVRRDPFELVRHWGSVHHVQTRPAVRGRGLGMQLMREVRTLARKEMGLEQLHLAARAGVGPLPGSSTSCGESPHDAPLRSATLCLLCATLSYPTAMPGGATGVDTVAGHGAAKLVQTALLIVAVYFLMCFYLYSAADEEASRRRANKEAVAVVAVVVVITLAAVSVPHGVFAGSFGTADMTVPQIAVFYGGAGCYLPYVLGLAARWTRAYARTSRRSHATGLWMAAVGLGAKAVACAIRAVIVAVRWADIEVSQCLMAAMPRTRLMVAMLSTPGRLADPLLTPEGRSSP